MYRTKNIRKNNVCLLSLNDVPFWALEIEPYSASGYLEAPQPSTRVPIDV